MSRYKIALDAMGGDHAPDAIVRGAIRAMKKYADIDVLLAGPQVRIEALLADVPENIRSRVEILNATEVIEMDEAPMLAVSQKEGRFHGGGDERRARGARGCGGIRRLYGRGAGVRHVQGRPHSGHRASGAGAGAAGARRASCC